MQFMRLKFHCKNEDECIQYFPSLHQRDNSMFAQWLGKCVENYCGGNNFRKTCWKSGWEIVQNLGSKLTLLFSVFAFHHTTRGKENIETLIIKRKAPSISSGKNFRGNIKSYKIEINLWRKYFLARFYATH